MKHIPRIAVLTLLSSLLAAACSDALVTGEYLGEPLITVEGRIVMDSDTASESQLEAENLRVAVFWTRAVDADGLARLDGRIDEQQVVTRTSFPARYALTLYRPPDASVVQDVPRGSGRLAVGLLLLYHDTNEDGRWDRADEPLSGGSPGYVLAWADGEVRSSLVGGRLGAGYHLMAIGRTDACLDGVDLALMRKASDDSNIDLTVSTKVTEVIPDADCDGFVDLCAEYLDAIDRVPDDARQDAIARWQACVSGIWDRDMGCPPEDPACQPDVIAAEERICEALLGAGDAVCSVPECFEGHRRAFELCFSPELRQACYEPLSRALASGPPPDLGALEDLTGCLLDLAPYDPAIEDCIANAHATCETLLGDPALEPPDEQRWIAFEDCLNREQRACAGQGLEQCLDLRTHIESCADPNCFEAGMNELRRCEGGALTPDEGYLCEWWLWQGEVCAPDNGCDPNTAFHDCLVQYGFGPPDPEALRRSCDAACQQARQDDPNAMGVQEELEACRERLGEGWACEL